MRTSDLLVVSDLDGTLLDESKSISDKSLAALDALRAAGGRFTIATGRSVESARKYIRLAGVELPAIVYNGVMLYDYQNDRPLWNDLLPDRARGYIARLMEAFPTVGFEVLRADQIYVLRTNRHVKTHVEVEMLKHTHCTLDEVGGDWFKVLMAMDAALVPEVERFVRAQAFDGVDFVHSSEPYYEMLPAGASKGNALRMLCSMFGQDLTHTAAIGDFNNDIEMIACAGFGGAMGNAPDAVKAAADVVVADNERDGFAAFVAQASRQYYG